MPTEILLVYSTCPSQVTARQIADLLIGQRLAACVSILPAITSVYHWQEKIETSEEHLLMIKCNKSNYAALEQAVLDAHPYELPEIVAVPVDQGLPGYIDWIDQCTK